MALQIKLKQTGISAEGDKIYLEDITGAYSAANLGGYGLPNPTKSEVAIIVLPVYKSSKGDVVGTMVPYPGVNNTLFTANATVDGWYQMKVAIVPLFSYAQLASYSDGEVRFDPSTGSFHMIRTIDVPGNASYQSFITVSRDILKDSTYINSVLDIFFVANSSKTKLRVNELVTELIYAGATFSDKKLIRFKENLDVVRAILEGSMYEFARNNKYLAQKSIEFLNSNDYVPE